MTAAKLEHAMDAGAGRVSRLINAQTSVTGDMALRLADAFGPPLGSRCASGATTTSPERARYASPDSPRQADAGTGGTGDACGRFRVSPLKTMGGTVSDSVIIVYWRPGCGFCSALLRGLDRAGLVFDRVDIWQDEVASGFVRSVAGGNETVPTVRIGDVALVNPALGDVLREVAVAAPDQLPDGYKGPWPGALGRGLTRLFGG